MPSCKTFQSGLIRRICKGELKGDDRGYDLTLAQQLSSVVHGRYARAAGHTLKPWLLCIAASSRIKAMPPSPSSEVGKCRRTEARCQERNAGQLAALSRNAKLNANDWITLFCSRVSYTNEQSLRRWQGIHFGSCRQESFTHLR